MLAALLVDIDEGSNIAWARRVGIEDRPYRLALSCSDAYAELRRVAGAQLDPRCVDGFLELLAEREPPAKAVIHYWPERDGFAVNGSASSSQRAAAS